MKELKETIFAEVNHREENEGPRFSKLLILVTYVLHLVVIACILDCEKRVGLMSSYWNKELKRKLQETEEFCIKRRRYDHVFQSDFYGGIRMAKTDDQWCIEVSQESIKTLYQTIESIPSPLLQRLNEFTDDTKLLTAEANGTRGDLVPGRPSNMQEKSSLHLLGTFRPSSASTGGQFSWSNTVAPCGLMVTRDHTEVVATVSGNYYMYASIGFRRNGQKEKSQRGRFTIYRIRNTGIVRIPLVMGNVLTDVTSEIGTVSTQRVIYLYKGDRIVIQVAKEDLPYVSLEPDAHVFGLFEI